MIIDLFCNRSMVVVYIAGAGMKIRRGEQKSVRVKGVRKAGGQKRLDVGAESNKVALFFSKRAAHNTLPKGERVHFPTSEHNFPSSPEIW